MKNVAVSYQEHYEYRTTNWRLDMINLKKEAGLCGFWKRRRRKRRKRRERGRKSEAWKWRKNWSRKANGKAASKSIKNILLRFFPWLGAPLGSRNNSLGSRTNSMCRFWIDKQAYIFIFSMYLHGEVEYACESKWNFFWWLKIVMRDSIAKMQSKKKCFKNGIKNPGKKSFKRWNRTRVWGTWLMTDDWGLIWLGAEDWYDWGLRAEDRGLKASD